MNTAFQGGDKTVFSIEQVMTEMPDDACVLEIQHLPAGFHEVEVRLEEESPAGMRHAGSGRQTPAVQTALPPVNPSLGGLIPISGKILRSGQTREGK